MCRCCNARDTEVDALYGAVLQRVFAWMRDHPEQIPAGQAVASAAKYLERVADHATNLAKNIQGNLQRSLEAIGCVRGGPGLLGPSKLAFAA